MINYHKPNIKVTNTGIGFPGMLALLFIALRLTGYVSWPWIWVLSPLWIPPVLLFSFVLIASFACLFAASRPSRPGESEKRN